MSKQFPEKSKTIYTNAGFGVDEVSKEAIENNMLILKGIAQEQENKIKLLEEELSQLKASNQFDNLVKDERGKLIRQLKEELKREREGNDLYGNIQTYTEYYDDDKNMIKEFDSEQIEYHGRFISCSGKKAREIIAQRKIKDEDL